MITYHSMTFNVLNYKTSIKISLKQHLKQNLFTIIFDKNDLDITLCKPQYLYYVYLMPYTVSIK